MTVRLSVDFYDLRPGNKNETGKELYKKVNMDVKEASKQFIYNAKINK